MNIENYNKIKNELPQGVTLVAVSKYYPAAEVRQNYALGQRVFAESRPQELQAKIAELREDCPDIQWHFIGHLQTNKLKMVLPYVSLVQSVDSLHLLEAISRYCMTNGLVVNVLLEVHIAHEETKQGFSTEEVIPLLRRAVAGDFPGVSICGLMGMASNSEDEALVRGEFEALKALFEECRDALLVVHEENKTTTHLRESFTELSMGMSGDYRLAIAAGATMVRIGSLIYLE